METEFPNSISVVKRIMLYTVGRGGLPTPPHHPWGGRPWEYWPQSSSLCFGLFIGIAIVLVSVPSGSPLWSVLTSWWSLNIKHRDIARSLQISSNALGIPLEISGENGQHMITWTLGTLIAWQGARRMTHARALSM